jgi:hypothetical protein
MEKNSMRELELVKITDTSGKNTGNKDKVIYQALTDDELDNLIDLQGGYSYIGWDFKIEMLGKVQIPSFSEENDATNN